MLNRRSLLSWGSLSLALTALPMAATAQDQTAPAPVDIEIADMTLGNPDAPVTVIEYASYTCPHCATFHQTVMPQLKADYIDTGKINFVYREVYFDLPGLWASIVARCGGELRYFAISDVIYEKQREWAASGEPATIAAELQKIGLAAGLGQDQLDACFSDRAAAEALVAHFEKNMEEFTISGTPSIVINGAVLGNMSYADLSAEIDGRLSN